MDTTHELNRLTARIKKLHAEMMRLSAKRKILAKENSSSKREMQKERREFRLKYVAEARSKGVTFREIGEKFGVTASRASSLFRLAKRIEERKMVRDAAGLKAP